MKKSIAYLLSLLLCSCQGSTLIHGKTITQGRVISKSQVRQIKLGLDKNQVAVILGSPVLVSSFSSNHWIYLYSYKEQWQKVKLAKIGLHLIFDNNSHLIKIIQKT